MKFVRETVIFSQVHANASGIYRANSLNLLLPSTQIIGGTGNLNIVVRQNFIDVIIQVLLHDSQLLLNNLTNTKKKSLAILII